jgi:hypothetical protein
MGFLDKAKAAATELAAKADGALANAGMNPGGTATASNRDVDRLLRDLGVWTFREASGMADAADGKTRTLAALQQLQASNQLPPLTTSDQAPPPPGGAAAGFNPGATPPPPGAAAGFSPATPPPPGAATAPPAPGGYGAPEQPTVQSGGGDTPPPPPPSWAK